MTLAQKLADMVAGSAARIPAEARQVMHTATEALIASGAADRAPKVGERLPALELPGPDGPVSLAAGPAVITWFRGNW